MLRSLHLDSDLPQMAAWRRVARGRLVSWLDTDESEAKFLQILNTAKDMEWQGGVVEDKAGPAAMILIWKDSNPWMGAPLQWIHIEVRPDSQAYLAAEQLIHCWAEKICLPGELALVALHEPVRAALDRHGIRVHSIESVGDIQHALMALESATLPHEVNLRPMLTTDSDAIIRLHEEAFADGKYCWFGANPGFLQHKRQELLQSMDSHWVAIVSDQVVGWICASTSNQAVWPNTVGLGVVFVPEYRGRGLLRPMMKVALTEAYSSGFTRYRGSTSQPAVRHLGKILERTPVLWHMGRQSTWKWEHFQS